LVAPAASGSESTIYPGVGIGRIKLGMTQSQVQRILGHQSLPYETSGAYHARGWDFSNWVVGFVANRVVQVETTLASQRTTEGVGFGTTWRRLVKVYPHGACTWGAYQPDSFNTKIWPEYLVGHKGGTQTLYVFKPLELNYASIEVALGVDRVPLLKTAVNSVVVRTKFRALPEFGPNWHFQCGEDRRAIGGYNPGLKLVGEVR
jgi:hypothetical protein